MKNKHIKSLAIALLISILAIGAWSSSALAAPIIQNISIDNGTSPPTISIVGTALCNNAYYCTSLPKIVINGSALAPLWGSRKTLLKVLWTPPSTPGNFLVRVTNSKGTTTSILTTGAVGAVGATGPQGPIGLTGAPGAAGTSVPVHVIGESYQGGIVFYVDADGQHGLIAARADQSAGIQWYNGVAKITGASGDGIGAGVMNTAIIVATQISDNQTGNFAAKVAADYSVQDDGVTACTAASGSAHPPVTETCYGDWYLPSKVEFNLLYNQQAVVGGFAVGSYWSSTESDSGLAWDQYFSAGIQGFDGKGYARRVRAVRAF